MKKSGRRILIIVLSIMMIMTYMIPGSVFADTAGASDESATEVHEHDLAIEDLSEGDDGGDAVSLDTVDDQSAEDPAESTEGEATEAVPEAEVADETVTEEVTEEPAEEFPVVEETVTVNDTAKAAAGGLSVLAFTSDTHNQSNNTAANRLGTWLDKMASTYGSVDVMAFGGDMADAGASSTTFWTYTQADMDKLDDRGIPGVYTTGNHEYSPGSYTHDRNSTTQQYKEDQQGYEGSNYRIYCLGSSGSGWNNYSNAQITTLTNYLNSVDSSKPIIIITHYPLHYYGSRTISNASNIIDVLNTASDSGKKIVYLWGHNHTESDTNYDEIFKPGDSISYSSGNSKEIKFYYGAAGCMSDRDYGSGSGSVKGKGLIITINSKNQLSFAYHNADGLNVTENGNEGQGTSFTEQDPVYATSMSLSAQTATVEVGRTLKPKLEVSFQPEDTNFKAVTWTSSNPSVASVDSTGKVKGVSQGTTVITATYALEGSNLSASCTVTVVPRTTSDPEYVIRIGNYALSTEHSTDSYSSGGSYFGGSTYNGMVAVPYTAGSGADDSIRWILEESDDGSGYYIKNSEDLYLNATYESSGSYFSSSTTDLKLGDTPEVWKFEGDLDDWLVDGSKLMHVSTGRYLAEETGSAGTHLITLRSSDNADTTIGELASDPVAVTGVSVTPATTSVKERETVQLTATVTPADATNKKVTWSSSNTAIATVDEKGLVKGVAEGSVTITATTVDGSFSAASTVTVIHNDNPSVEETISITPSTDNPEQSITINVGDTLVINTTNGSSNSGYNYTATLTNSSVAQIQGDSTINIAAGATGQFTVAGIADGTVDINIQNDQSSSQYVRKAVIHLTVGEGGTTPVDPPTGDTVSITPTTDNPEESIKINVGDTLTINVTNGSSNSAYDFTATLANSSVAQIQGNSTVNIAAGGTGQFTVKGIADGTVDITIQNSNSYGSQYTRKGIIHLTVGEGGTTPVDPPTGDTVNITPTTDNPEESIKINVGETLTINVTNGSSNSAYDFTATLANSSVAQIQGNSTVNIAAGATGQFTVKGIANGTVDITIQNSNTYGSQYTRKGIIHLTVGEGTTPIEPPVGDTVTYQQTDTLEADKDYIIVSGNSGSVYVLSTDANGSRTLKGIAATVSDGLITLSATDAAKAVFTAEGRGTAGGTVSVWLKNNGQYLYTDSSSGLRMVASSTQTGSSNSNKVWHYKADDKNLLWFFNSSSADGYTDTSSTYKYYLEVSNGNFTDNHADSTSLANTTTPKIYLFEKYEGPLEVTGVSLDKTALTLKVGQTGTLTATVVPSGATNKEVTWSSSNPSVATVDSNGKVTAVKAGTATITVTTVENNKTATCTVTVKEAGAGTDFVLTDKLEDGKDYLIANGNTGNVYIVSNEANGSRKLKAISVEVVGDTITIDDETADKAVFTAEGKTSTSGSDSAWLKNGSQYLYTNNADGLRVSSDQTATDNTGKYWHYKADGKNLLWYFKDTSSSDGYTDTSGTYKYYLEVSGSDFTDNHVSSTSLANSNTPKIYLFVKDDSTPQPHTHTYTGPVWTWASDNSTATATFTCSECGDVQTVAATVTQKTEADGSITYTATAAFEGKNYTDTKSSAHQHTLVKTDAKNATCTEAGNTAYWRCSGCGKYFGDAAGNNEILEGSWVIKALGHDLISHAAQEPTCTEIGWDAYYTCSRCDYTTYVEKPATGHDWNTPTYEWAADYKTATASRSCNNGSHPETETVNTTSQITTPATCETKGVTTYTATFTNAAFGTRTTTVENVDALGHNWTFVGFTWTGNDTDGYTAVKADYKCNRDASHTQSVAAELTNVTSGASCTEPGTVTYTASISADKALDGKAQSANKTVASAQLGHDWGAATYEWAADNSSVTATHVCKRDASHTESETVTATSEVTSAPTCTAKGETVYTADFTKEGFAQQIKTVETDMLAHTLTHHDAVAAQCEAAGNVEYWSCDVCKKLFSDAEGKTETTAQAVVVPASGHSPSTDAAKAPTCDESGLTEGSHCAICGKILKAQEVVPALGHDWGEITYAWESDNSKVTATRVCSRDASHVDTETVNTTVEVIAEGSCTEDGETKYTATFQKEEFAVQTKTVITEATGHKWDAGKVTKEPTYRTDGEMTYTCTVCGATYTEPIPKQGWKRDSDNNWNYINPDGTKATGWKQVGDYWYYMDKAGVMQTGWTKVGNKWYYMNKNGAMQTGWQKIGGKWYYFASSGAMQTGWQEINGKTYYFKSSGVMADKEWVSGYWWINAGGTWTYKYRASWEKTADGHWMFKATNGWIAKSVTYIINDVSYTFDANGYMI